MKCPVEFQVQVPASALGFRVLQVHPDLLDPGLLRSTRSSPCSRVSKHAAMQIVDRPD